jgi:alanine-glyoxylate transaminase/serine-glyoxylate transaminase/serine-pyruvate transaminase
MDTFSFHPPRRTLMGPGPSDVPSRVLAAMSEPTIGHLDPAFVRFMDSTKDLLRYAFRTGNELTLPVSGPGSAGMEACFVNLVEPGDKVIVCVNGVFGGRMRENVIRSGGVAVAVEQPWGEPVDPGRVERALKEHPDAKILAFVHAETSTGALSDAGTLVGLARRSGALTIVDAVTSLGGVPVEVDEWGCDAVYSGSQKCLSAPPGLAPVTFSPRALEVIRGRKTPVRSWFFDMNLILGYWGSTSRRSYHHTAPINMLYALHESLVMLREETVEASWQRHRRHHRAFVAGIEAMGLSMHVAEPFRLPQLNAVRVPSGIDEALVRQRLLQRHGLEIGGGIGELAGKIWRIGLMGYASRRENVLLCLGALEDVLAGMGAKVHRGSAAAAAEDALGES